MKQSYLEHLASSYPNVSIFYFTSEGTAFADLNQAKGYSRKLEDSTVKSVGRDQKIEDAVVVDTTVKPVGETGGEYIDQTGAKNEPENEPAGPIDYNSLKLPKLKEMCDARGIEVPNKATKALLVELLTSADVNDAKQAEDNEPEIDVNATEGDEPTSSTAGAPTGAEGEE